MHCLQSEEVTYCGRHLSQNYVALDKPPLKIWNAASCVDVSWPQASREKRAVESLKGHVGRKAKASEPECCTLLSPKQTGQGISV